MKNIYNQKLNIALTFTLVAVFLRCSFSYGADLYADNALRVSLGEYARVEKVFGSGEKGAPLQRNRLGGPKWWVTNPETFTREKYFRFLVKQAIGPDEIIYSLKTGKIGKKEVCSVSLIDPSHMRTISQGRPCLMVSVEDEAVLLARPEDKYSGFNKKREEVLILKKRVMQEGRDFTSDPDELLRQNLPWQKKKPKLNLNDWTEVIIDLDDVRFPGIILKIPFTEEFMYGGMEGKKALKGFLEDLFEIDVNMPVIVLETPKEELMAVYKRLPRTIRQAERFVKRIRDRVTTVPTKSTTMTWVQSVGRTIWSTL